MIISKYWWSYSLRRLECPMWPALFTKQRTVVLLRIAPSLTSISAGDHCDMLTQSKSRFISMMGILIGITQGLHLATSRGWWETQLLGQEELHKVFAVLRKNHGGQILLFPMLSLTVNKVFMKSARPHISTLSMPTLTAGKSINWFILIDLVTGTLLRITGMWAGWWRWRRRFGSADQLAAGWTPLPSLTRKSTNFLKSASHWLVDWSKTGYDDDTLSPF